MQGNAKLPTLSNQLDTHSRKLEVNPFYAIGLGTKPYKCLIIYSSGKSKLRKSQWSICLTTGFVLPSFSSGHRDWKRSPRIIVMLSGYLHYTYIHLLVI